MRIYNFGGTGRNLTKLYQKTWVESGVIKWTLILQRGAKFGRVKRQKLSAIFSSLIANVSRTGRHIENRKKYLINYISSPIERKKFGELWSTNKKVIGTHVDWPNWSFSTEYISAHVPSNFYTPYNPINCISSKLSLGRCVAWSWTLPHISSFVVFYKHSYNRLIKTVRYCQVFPPHDATQTAILIRHGLSDRMSVRPSVTLRYSDNRLEYNFTTGIRSTHTPT